jgi:subtilisin family serine protease
MTPVRRAPRSLALAAVAFMVGSATALPAVAAGPPSGSDPDLRAARNAWDRPLADDPGRLIVTFRPGTSTLSRQASLRAAGANRQSVPIARTTVVVVPADRAAATTTALEEDPHVERVSVDHRRFREADPTSEPYWNELWGLDNTGQDLYGGVAHTGGAPDADIDGRQAIGITIGSPTTVVAVIDDGVDFSHPDLAARAWTNPGESGDGKETNGIDDDGNGYVDDVHGWDFCHDDNTVHDVDDDFHGTHVAGIIAASLDGVGVVGVAPGVKIMALKFLGDDPGCGYDSMAIAAIAYAKSFGVRIANASWGGVGAPADAPELHDAIRDSGMLFVAAAGNDGSNNDHGPWTTLPASFDLPNIVSVAAMDNTGGLAGFSNYGSTTVDIAAPGEAILSSLPAETGHPTPGWGWLDGTSMAAPHVSGVAALVASVWPSIADDPTVLRARIVDSGKADSSTTGLTATGRVVDAYRALDAIGPVAARPNTFSFVLGAQMSSTSAIVRVGWPVASDDRTGIGAYSLGQRAGVGSWTTAVATTSARSSDRRLTIGTAWGVRVRARDGAGNWGTWTSEATITPVRYQQTSSTVSYSGSWRTLHTSSASGGSERYATRRGASVTFRFTGRAFAIVSPKGASRGTAKMYVDGHYVSTVNLHRSTWIPRIVVAGRSWSSSGSHTVKLVVDGTAGHPRFDVDAFLVLR